MSYDFKDLATQIVAIVGKENIIAAEHCATRLRLIVKDKDAFEGELIAKLPGVKGQFFAAQQYQIIFGTGTVNKVYNELEKLIIKNCDSSQAAYQQMTVLQKISRSLGDIFIPIIPILVATGLFMGLRGLLLSFGIKIFQSFINICL